MSVILALYYILKLINIFFLISDPPKFEETPRDQSVINDRVASFTCRAVGNPQPTIEWRKNGKRVGTNNNNRISVINIPGGSILRIEPVKFIRDDSEVECVAENSAGDLIQAKARLEVLSDDRECFFSYFYTYNRRFFKLFLLPFLNFKGNFCFIVFHS